MKGKQAACSTFESTNYLDYQKLTATSEAKSWAFRFNVAASYMGFGGKANGGGSSMFSDSTKFQEAVTSIQNYKSWGCSNSSITSLSDSRISGMATYIEPKVHEAYKQCLALGQSGMDISQTVGYMSRSITIDILWNAPSGTATARLQGLFVYPAGAATCKLYAYATPGTTAVRRLLWEGEPEGLDAEAAATDPANTFGVGGRRRMHQSVVFPLTLIAESYYTLFCKVTASAPKNNYTEVYISTDVSGSYRALMYNSQRNEEIKRIAALEATMNLWQTKLKPLPGGGGIRPDRFCIRENCVQKSGNNMVVAHRRTGSVRMEINLDPNAQDRFRVYAGAAPNPQDTFFYVNKQDQFGFWNLATGDVMRTIADKYCVSNGADCITRIKPWIGFGGSPPAIGYDQTNPIWLDRHNISCMVPGAILSSVEAGYPFGFPTYNQAGMLYDAGCAYFCGPPRTTLDPQSCYIPDPPKRRRLLQETKYRPVQESEASTHVA